MITKLHQKMKAGEPCEAKLNVADLLPDNWDSRSKEFQNGFMCAVATMLVKGKILPDNEKH